MVKLYSEALEQTIEVDRFIGKLIGSSPGPTCIFVGGIHGNEPAGVIALHKVFEQLQKNETPIRGNIYGISGNLSALKTGRRYHKFDLNRLWSAESIRKIKANENCKEEECEEQNEIYREISNILATDSGPFYFFDLHTTSGETNPFITVNDNLLNRYYTLQYPIPKVLGIEEYLNGPLLSYINELGYIAFGFEGGQHDDLSSIENHTAFVYLSLVYSNSIKKDAIEFDHFFSVLNRASHLSYGFYEILAHRGITHSDDFEMKPNFINFQRIEKGQLLASHNGRDVRASRRGRIFMPLYQDQGNDGFFVIRSIPSIFLKLSAIMRRIRLDNFLTIFPGVNWDSTEKNSLRVNLKLARFFTKDFFHLLGYRSKRIDKNHLIMKNREIASRWPDYLETKWYKKRSFGNDPKDLYK